MGRRGLVHPRTYLKNDPQTLPNHRYYSHARHFSTAAVTTSPASKGADPHAVFAVKGEEAAAQKKHFRHSSSAPRKVEMSPLVAHHYVEIQSDSGQSTIAQKLVQFSPRFMVGSACVWSKRRRYFRSKKARDSKHSFSQRASGDETETSPNRSDCDHSDGGSRLPAIAITESAVVTDETETDADEETQLLCEAGRFVSDCDGDAEDDSDDEECVLFIPQPVKAGIAEPEFADVDIGEYDSKEEDDDDGDEEEEYEVEEEGQEVVEEPANEPVNPGTFDSLPSPVLEAILKHSDKCTRYALGYTCVRWNRVAISSGIEWCSHHHETVENLLINEAEHPPVLNYALVHPYITPMLRLAYADWLCNIARDTDQPPVVLPLAFRLFDRTLSSAARFPLHQLQALAAACFWIASKVRGSGSLMASEMCVFSGGLFTPQVICSLERFVMDALNFRLQPPVTRDFLELYLDNSTRLLSCGYDFTVDDADEVEHMLCVPSVEFDEWAEQVRQNCAVTVADCMSFLETLTLHLYSFAMSPPSVLSAAIFSVSLGIVTGTAPLRSALVRFATHAFLIEDPAVAQCCSLLMSTCVMVQEVHECKFLRTAFPAFFPQCLYTEQ